MNSGRVANVNLLKMGYILGGRGIFWEGRTCKFVEKGVSSRREGKILGWSHM